MRRRVGIRAGQASRISSVAADNPQHRMCNPRRDLRHLRRARRIRKCAKAVVSLAGRPDRNHSSADLKSRIAEDARGQLARGQSTPRANS